MRTDSMERMRGLVIMVRARHRDHQWWRYSNRRYARTSLWAMTEVDDGNGKTGVLEVWIETAPGRSGKLIWKQEEDLVQKGQDLVGKEIDFDGCWETARGFFRGFAEQV